jgi:hypothetical protein
LPFREVKTMQVKIRCNDCGRDITKTIAEDLMIQIDKKGNPFTLPNSPFELSRIRKLTWSVIDATFVDPKDFEFDEKERKYLINSGAVLLYALVGDYPVFCDKCREKTVNVLQQKMNGAQQRGSWFWGR